MQLIKSHHICYRESLLQLMRTLHYIYRVEIQTTNTSLIYIILFKLLIFILIIETYVNKTILENWTPYFKI
jgi:hypothetical protein